MAKASFAVRLKSLFGFHGNLDEEFFEELADYLVEGDLGPGESMELAERLKDSCRREGIRGEQAIRERLAALIIEWLSDPSITIPDLELHQDELSIFLLLGVNGVGKTTSVAKLAAWYRKRSGEAAILAAGDTFRAAAIEQLQIHGDRLDLRVVAHRHGGDPAAVIYDAIEAARGRKARLIIADTAGRMHTKQALLEELRKIDRVVETRSEGARYRKLLVLDSTTGRNALAQAEAFCEAVRPDGVILTKYDSSARGGIACSLARNLKLPVVFLCDGEGYDALRPFDPEQYAKEFVGLA